MIFTSHPMSHVKSDLPTISSTYSPWPEGWRYLTSPANWLVRSQRARERWGPTLGTSGSWLVCLLQLSEILKSISIKNITNHQVNVCASRGILWSTNYYYTLGCSLVDPWVKSWLGQLTIGWLKISLLDIQNHGTKKFREVTERELTRLSAFFACVSWCLEFPSTNMTEPTESMWLCMKNFFSLEIYSTHLAMHLLQCGFSHE